MKILSVEFIGAVAFSISVLGSAIYIRSILKRETKPHFYTWLVFGIITTIAFFAQLYDRGGQVLGRWELLHLPV